MNIQNYDSKTVELIEKVFEQKRLMDEDIFNTLPVLLERAQELEDYTLQGFAHFHIADAYFAFEKGYKKFRENLARCIYCFNLGGEKELLTRAYNFVAIDALNNGSFDVAYFYLMNAMQTCEGTENNYLLSMLNHNIGQVFARMHSFDKAVGYVRLGTEFQLLCPADDFYYYQNLTNGYFSEGVIHALMGNVEGAKAADREIARLENETDVSNNPSVFIPIILLRIMIAILEGDEEEYEVKSRELIEKLRESHRIYDFITDIEDLCNFLLEKNHMDTVGEILSIIKDTVADTDVVQMQKIVSSIEVAYYDKLGDAEKVNECLREQYHLSKQQQMEQNRIYQYSIDLINSMDEQRKEQERVRLENEYLQSQVQTDPLTGIPNRFMLDSTIPQFLEEAKKEGKSFAVSLMDIDKFKQYNDTYGHLDGDICLQKVAKAIEKVSDRPGVSCARYGGDEFIMLYCNKTDEEIMKIAAELKEEIKALNIPHSAMGEGGCVSLSQGICNDIPRSEHKHGDYLNEADNALYVVKKRMDSPGKKETFRLVHLP